MSLVPETRWKSRVVVAPIALAAATLGLFAPGCDGTTAETNNTPGEIQYSIPADTLGLLSKMSRSTETVAFLGTRLYQLYDGQSGAPLFSYREEVASDGAGQFSVEVLDLIEPTLPAADEALQLQLLAGRSGLLYRYRGFGVRDLTQFLDNYNVIDLGTIVSVAGVDASELWIELAFESPGGWRVAVDVTNGLVLRAVEEDGFGAMLSSVEFETLDYGADLSGVAWHQPSNSEIPVLPGEPSPFSFTLLDPVLVPDGYLQVGLAQVSGPGAGEVWAKRAYTNGVDTLFFLQSDVPAKLDNDYMAPEVSSYRVGAWQVLDGHVAKQRVILMGKVLETDLAQMLQSSL